MDPKPHAFGNQKILIDGSGVLANSHALSLGTTDGTIWIPLALYFRAVDCRFLVDSVVCYNFNAGVGHWHSAS